MIMDVLFGIVYRSHAFELRTREHMMNIHILIVMLYPYLLSDCCVMGEGESKWTRRWVWDDEVH
jgi:hypothetical protein